MPAQRILRVQSIAEAVGFGPTGAFDCINAALASLPEDRRTKEGLLTSLSPSSTPTQLLAAYLLLPDKPPIPCSDTLLQTALKLLQSLSVSDLPVRLTLVLVTAIFELEANERIVGQASLKLPAAQADLLRISELGAKWPPGLAPKALGEARTLAEARRASSDGSTLEKRERWQRAWCNSCVNAASPITWTSVRLLVRFFLTSIPHAAPLPAELLARLGPDGDEAVLPSLQTAALHAVRTLIRLARQRDPQHALWLALQLYEAAALPALLKAVLASYPSDTPMVSPAPPYVSTALRLLRRVAEPFPSAARLLVRLRAPVVLKRVIDSHAHGVERHAALRLHCALAPYLGRKWPRIAVNAPLVTLFYMELPPRLFSPLSLPAEPEEEGNAVVAASEMEEKAHCNRLRLHTTQLFMRYGNLAAVAAEAQSETDAALEREASEWVNGPEGAALYAAYADR